MLDRTKDRGPRGAGLIKHRIQRALNECHDIDEVWTVGKATPKEVRAFKPVGFKSISRQS